MKRALVISGGGSKGAFAVGFLKELFLTWPHLEFDTYVGSSTGSLVVSLAAAGKMEVLENLYTNITTDELLIKGNIVDKLNDTSLFDVSPLWKLIQEHLTDDDYEKIRMSGRNVCLNTVCLQTNGLIVFSNNAAAVVPTDYEVWQTRNANHFRRAMLASCCQPVFMQPIQVGRGVPGASHPEYQFVDGGVLEYVGIQMAIDAGATDILAIMLSPEKDGVVDMQFTTLMQILGETIDILVSDVGKSDVKLTVRYNESLRYIEAVKKKMREAGLANEEIENYFDQPDNPFRGKRSVNLVQVRPDKPLGGGPGGLNFFPEEMRGMLAAGRLMFEDIAKNGGMDSFLV